VKNQRENEWLAQQKDSYFKLSLRGAARNYYKRIKKIREREISFDALSKEEQKHLSHFDQYDINEFSFKALDEKFSISDDELGKALSKLPGELLSIVLLSFFLGMNDREIGEQLKMGNSTVAYRRNRTIEKLRELMEETK